MMTKQLIWEPEQWSAFKAQAALLSFSGLKGDTLWDRIEKLPAPLFEAAARENHGQVHEETMRFLATRESA